MATKSDKSFLTLAALIFVFGVVVSFIEPAQGRDPMSRVNLLFFCFVAMSFLLAFCKQINVKTRTNKGTIGQVRCVDLYGIR